MVVGGAVVVEVVESFRAVVVGAGGAVVVGATEELVTDIGGDVDASSGAVDEEHADMMTVSTTTSGSAHLKGVIDIRRD